MSKSNIHKKETFEDRFARRYSGWVRNNPKTWRYLKKRNIRQFRRKMKQQLEKEQT